MLILFVGFVVLSVFLVKLHDYEIVSDDFLYIAFPVTMTLAIAFGYIVLNSLLI